MGRKNFLHCSSLLILILAVCILAAAQKAATNSGPQSGVIVGVLEDIPAQYGEPDQRAVRVVFQKSGAEWIAFPSGGRSYHDLETFPASYPPQVTWTIAFDGRSLGTVAAETPAVFQSNSEVGVQEITSDNAVPVVGEKSQAYSGFRITPIYRPLVALSQPNFSDPEMWKPAQPSPALTAAARQLFRNRFPKTSNCAGSGASPKPLDYINEDVKVVNAYASNIGWSLIELSLTGWACDTIAEYGGPFEGQWYAADASGNLSFLGADMDLVDAGDYDNDGHSEVLFSIDGRNTGGYRLYYQKFTRSAEFVFYYH
jgi:hypothetical protein